MPESHLLLSRSLEGQYGHQTVDTLAFFIVLLIKNSSFLYHLHSVLILIIGNVSICLHSVNIIWNIVFKNGPNKICGGQHLNTSNWYGLLETDNTADNTPSYF